MVSRTINDSLREPHGLVIHGINQNPERIHSGNIVKFPPLLGWEKMFGGQISIK